MDVTSYDPKKVNVAVNGAIITGYASDSMITATKNEDAVTTEVAARAMLYIPRMRMRAVRLQSRCRELLPLCRVSEAWRQAGNRYL